MVLSTDKKLFTIFKWIIIIIPLLLFLLSIVYPMILKTAYIRSDRDFSRDQDYDSIISYIAEDILNERIDGDTYISNQFYEPLAWFNEYFGQVGVISRTAQYLGSHIGDGMQFNIYINFICGYLDYVIYIEIIFLCVYLFRWFIHFGFNLFERKKKL